MIWELLFCPEHGILRWLPLVIPAVSYGMRWGYRLLCHVWLWFMVRYR
jgi:hypothetical protein